MIRLQYMLSFKKWKKMILCNSKTSMSICKDRHLISSYQKSPENIDEEIVIPNRIHRESTDILRALFNTVGKDPTAAHYKYHDDPYLIPTTNITRRTFALAQESGRKAAHWVKQEHRDLFQHSEAQPPIKAFVPKMVFDENSEVDEKCLKDLIRDREVSDTIFVYKLMKSKNLSVNDNLKQELLELLCFYNHEDPISDDYIEERWFKQGTLGRERQRKTWKDSDLAEELFNEIEPKTVQSYSTIIRGMCKYGQFERAWQLFQECKEKQLQLDIKTYNSIISIVSYLKDTGDLRWDLCMDILKEIADSKLKPNIGTLNATLQTISTIGNYRLARSVILKTLSEFKKLDIEPCLGSWYYVLITLCKERGPVSHVLVNILNHIENHEFKAQDPKDTYFFVTAMDVCRNHLQDKNLAKRVNKLLHYGNNYNFIGDSYKESVYYRNYFALLCQTEEFTKFMTKIYDVLVPNVYIPEPGVMEEILKELDINGCIEYLPKIWSDMIIFDHVNRESLLNRVLNIMCTNRPNPNYEKQSNLNEKFAIIAWDIYAKINEQTTLGDENNVSGNNSGFRNYQKLSFTGFNLGSILSLLSRANDYEKSLQVFNKIDKYQHQIPGVPTVESIENFIDLCIKEKQPTQALNSLQYCVENNLINSSSNEPLVQKILKQFTLSEVHLSKLKSIIKEDIN